MSTEVHAMDQQGLAPFPMPDRFRHEIAYFMAAPDEEGVPKLGPGEYWIHRHQAQQWLADGCFYLVSPLDSEHPTEIELSEEQEAWLQWMVDHNVQHVKIVSR